MEVDEEWEEVGEVVGITGEGATLTGALVAATEVEVEVEVDDTVELPDGLGTQRLFRERLRGVGGTSTGLVAACTAT